MLKVLHVIWSVRYGGKEKLVYELALSQDKYTEISVKLLICKKNGEFLDKFQCSSLHCNFMQISSGFDTSPWKYIKIYRIFCENDIIHFHHFNPLIALIAIISRKKLLYSFHGKVRLRERCKIKDNLKLIFLKRFLNSSIDYISFNSEFTKNHAEKMFGLKSVKKSIIYNGLDFQSRLNKSCENNELMLSTINDKFVIGTVSRFISNKRMDLLIEAFSQFNENKNTELLIIGDGILRQDLEKKVQKLKLQNKVIFTGYKQNIMKYQKLMDVCVFPSKDEGFGLVALEALSLGKPTIVFKDGGGLAEIVGELSKSDVVNDTYCLQKRLEYYFKNRTEIFKNRERRIAHAKNFDISKTARQFYLIYEKLMTPDKL